MLETLLQIGKTLREAKRLRHHRYIKKCPISDKKSPIIYLSVLVDQEFNIDLNRLSEIHEEDFIRHKLYYLAFKSADTDSMMKYIFGDIFYGINKKGEETGYYRMSNPEIKNKFAVSSFYRGKEDAQTFNGSIIETFRQSFEINIEAIEKVLKEKGQNQQVFLHFDFQGKHWYEFEDELNAINQKLLADFLEEQAGKYILRKFLYKTLIFSTSQSPGFNSNNIFKTKAFQNHDEVMDLLYAINYSEEPLINERSIKIIVLPKGNNLEVTEIEEFFERKNNRVYYESEAEEKLKKAGENLSTEESLDRLFEPILVNVGENITQFDFIFSKKNVSGPDIDMIELSAIEKSLLSDIGQRAKWIRNKVNLLREKEFFNISNKLKPLDIRLSFINILGDVTKDKKKYQNHLLKVLPQIYTGTYYKDDLLLPAFIEKNEYNIRNDKVGFNLLKYDYYYLLYLQNTNGENLMEEMKNSKSYHAGLLLGKMAQPLNGKIASFQKNYVGLLSRRISDKQGLIKLANFINEKLAIHDVVYPNLKQSFIELANLIANISDKEYHKNYCAFGFFESYFAKLEASNKNKQDDQDN